MFRVKTLLIILLLLITNLQSYADGNSSFYFDAISFKSNSEEFASRIDFYATVPYQSLEFDYKKKYIAKYKISVKIINEKTKKIVVDDLISRTVVVGNYNESEGGNGEFDSFQKKYNIKSGKYRVEVSLLNSNQLLLLKKFKKLEVLNFDYYDFSLSGIMLLSGVEEVNKKMKLTPHLSDNIIVLEDGFFAFFEIYNRREGLSKVYLNYQILDNDNKLVREGKIIEQNLKNSIERKFIFIKSLSKKTFQNYKLKIIAKTNKEIDSSEKNILAITQHSISQKPSRNFNLDEDIKNSVKKLRYIATDKEIEEILNAKNDAEIENNFYQFWESKDPTPNTRKNEAFILYYDRIRYANENFKSIGQGWRSDMGHIYVVLGPPSEVINSNSMSLDRYKKWNYIGENRSFIFYDKSGFGEYKLREPYFFNEKFEYK